jgi:hypothetical protein
MWKSLQWTLRISKIVSVGQFRCMEHGMKRRFEVLPHTKSELFRVKFAFVYLFFNVVAVAVRLSLPFVLHTPVPDTLTSLVLVAFLIFGSVTLIPSYAFGFQIDTLFSFVSELETMRASVQSKKRYLMYRSCSI